MKIQFADRKSLDKISRAMKRAFKKRPASIVQIRPVLYDITKEQRGYYFGVVVPKIAQEIDKDNVETHELLKEKFNPRPFLESEEMEFLELFIQFEQWARFKHAVALENVMILNQFSESAFRHMVRRWHDDSQFAPREANVEFLDPDKRSEQGEAWYSAINAVATHLGTEMDVVVSSFMEDVEIVTVSAFGGSTTYFSKMEYSDYINKIIGWCGELGIEIPPAITDLEPPSYFAHIPEERPDRF